jgi:thioredoxin-like negative regulator of GroEL
MKTLLSLLLAVALSPVTFAAGPATMTDLKAAMGKAKAEQKMLFVQFGRDTCETCRQLRGYIQNRNLHLPEGTYVYADVDIDDPAMVRAFIAAKFHVEGEMLPFVVVAGPDGKQLASRSGPGTVKEYEKLLKEVQTKAP